MSARTLSIFSILCFCFWGCTKNQTTTTVTTNRTVYFSDRLNIGLVGYDSTEVETVIVKKFLPDNTFSNFVDSTILINTAIACSNWFYFNSTKPNDSLCNPLYTILDVTDTAYKQYDYEVIIPWNQRVYKISAISFSGNISITEPECCLLELSTRNANYTLGTTTYTNVAPMFFEGVYVWLQK